jgi:peptidoglycan hydrolase-like protein with peptidoglycan-binding domain
MAFTRVLRIGDKGNDVRLVQQALGIKVDGDFGRATKTAVEEFQKNNGLTVDGVVGSITWEALGLNNPTISLAPKTPQSINQIRLEERIIRQQVQQTVELQQVPESVIEDSTPEQVKSKGKNKLGQRILNLGRQVIKLVITKLQSLAGEYLLDQFIQAREEAITQGTEAIAQVKEQYCPAPATLNQLIETRNNIVDQLNGIGNRLNLANTTVQGLTSATNVAQTTINLANTVQTGLNLAAASGILLGPALGPVVANINNLQKIIEKVSPLITSTNSALYGTSVPLGVISYVITQAISLLSLLDVLINFCSTETDSPLTPISDTIQQVTIRQTQANINSGSYNGFVIEIEEVPFSPTVTRRKAVAFNQSGIALLETPLSFTTNDQTLINELKLIIDRDNLRAY